MKEYILKLYLSGRTSRNKQLIANLENFLEDQYSLEIVYVTEAPELAESAKVFCTPTLIKQLPKPDRRVVGDLTDKEKVLAGLSLPGRQIK